MNVERWRQIDELLEAALDQPTGERAAFLAEVCADDDALRHEVESLLRADQEAENLLEAPVVALAEKTLARARAEALTGREIGPYKILAQIGAGGMGEVYLAQDTRLGRKVALKLLPLAFSQDAERLRRFEQEGRAASALNHPNIITIHEIGQTTLNESATYYLVTEFVEGQTLRQRLATEPLPLRAAVAIAGQMASALVAAHTAGIVHRDIKPENIMVRPDEYVKVLDFGLAKLTAAADPMVGTDAQSVDNSTMPGKVLGTMRYMSPEQARGQKIDARTDIFSLGVVLYEMLAGQSPFAGASSADVIAAILERAPAPLPDVPPKLAQIVHKALRKDRAERYQTSQELAQDLKALQHELDAATHSASAELDATQPATARSVSGLTSSVSSRARSQFSQLKRRPARLLLALLTLSVVVFLVAGLSWRAWHNLAAASVDSLAVLPFTSSGGDVPTPELSLGLADALITKLGALNKIEVRPTAAIARYTEKLPDALRAGADLGVDAVLTGRIHRADGQMRVTVQLLRVADGKTVWAGSFDDQFQRLFALEDAMAEQVASALKLPLTSAERAQFKRQGTANLDAYQLYVKGRYFWNKRRWEWTKKGIECFEQALKLDPNYAQALAGLADSYALWNPEMKARERLAKAKPAAEKALTLDEQLPEAHASLGFIKYKFEWDWEGAERSFKRALELNPNYATAHHWYGEMLGLTGRFAEAQEQLQQAERLDPLAPAIKEDISMAWFRARQFDRAERKLREVMDFDPSYARAHNKLAEIYQAQGRYEEAFAELMTFWTQTRRPEAEIAQLQQTFRDGGWQAFSRKQIELSLATSPPPDGHQISKLYLRTGDRAQALVWLEKSFTELGEGPLRIKDPEYDSLRDNPKYQELLRRAGHEK